MKLSQLFKNWISIPEKFDVVISGLAINSQRVKSGDVFFALPGTKQDGFAYVPDAIARGAVAIIADTDTTASIDEYQSLPLIRLPQLRSLCSAIAAEYYSDPSAQMTVIGITGTNGKTSCAYFLAAALTQLGKIAGYMGTLGCGIYGDKIAETGLTTADPITVQQILAQMRDAGASVVAMEVSSHALAQDRVAGVRFTSAVFTNLTQDHLDYHGDMANYWAAKRVLFERFNLKHAIINADDPHGQELIQAWSDKQTMCAYTQNPVSENNSNIPMVAATQIQFLPSGIRAQIQTPVGSGELESMMVGRFNLANMLAVVATLVTLEVPIDAALCCIKQLPLVPGRMQVFRAAEMPNVVVDYAHTPDALENVLIALREIYRGKIWCVFGCGGDRDKTKRPIMGAIAEKLADHIVITDDNPRTELPKDIVANILTGISDAATIKVEHDRAAAIEYAIRHAGKNDVILVAGKGHEDYQEINHERKYFSDVEIVRDLQNRKT